MNRIMLFLDHAAEAIVCWFAEAPKESAHAWWVARTILRTGDYPSNQDYKDRSRDLLGRR